MKRVTLMLLLIIVIASCGSDKATDPFVPIDPANLLGSWDGTYALTYNTGTDSAHTYEVEVQIIFADTSFTFSGEPISSCATYGGGRYQIKGGILEFEDHTFRPDVCDGLNILHGDFTYGYNGNGSSPAELHLSHRFDGYSWQVDVLKGPQIGLD